MGSKTHAIVCFDVDNSVDAVPTSWIQDNENGTQSCWYPPEGSFSTRALRKAARKCEDAKADWICYPCRVMKLFGKHLS